MAATEHMIARAAGLWDEWRLFYTFEQVQQLRLIIFAHAPSISDNGKVQDKAELQEIGECDFCRVCMLSHKLADPGFPMHTCSSTYICVPVRLHVLP